MENHAKTIENLGKIIEKSEENHGNVRGKTSKIIGRTWEEEHARA